MVINHRVRVGGQQMTTRLQRRGDLAREPGESEAVADVVEHLAAHDQLEAPWYRISAHVELLEADMAKGAAAFTRPFDRGAAMSAASSPPTLGASWTVKCPSAQASSSTRFSGPSGQLERVLVPLLVWRGVAPRIGYGEQ